MSEYCPGITPKPLPSGQFSFAARCADDTESMVLKSLVQLSVVCVLLISASFRAVDNCGVGKMVAIEW